MMRKLVKWIAYYADGSQYDSEQWHWDEIPRYDMACVLKLFDDGTRQLLAGQDLFFEFEGCIANDNDRHMILRKLPWVKFGTWMEDSKYRQIWDKADEVGQQWRDEHMEPRPAHT